MSPMQTSSHPVDPTLPGLPNPQFGRGLRVLLALESTLARLGLRPSPARFVQRPVAERLAMKPAAWMTYPNPDGVAIRTQSIPSRGGGLQLRVFTCKSGASPRAIVLFMHGGGFIAGGMASTDYLCANLASKAGVTVASVEYRLSPEVRFPAALEDCYDALFWAAEHAAGAPVGVMGDSAGGNLAAALCLLARERKGPAIAKQVLLYPILDATLQSASVAYGSGGLDRAAMEQMLRLYLGDGDPRQPLVSPVLSPDLANLPPALILTAEGDPLRDDGLRYAQRLRSAGVPVEQENYADAPHGFFSMPRLCPSAPVALSRIAAFVAGSVTATDFS